MAFDPTYNATNVTLTVGPSPAPGLETPPLTASRGGEIYHEAHEGHEVGPETEDIFLTSDATVNTAEALPVTNALDSLKLDIAQSAALSKATGEKWLLYTA